MEKIKDIANQFCNKQKENILDISTNDSGNINRTYVVTYEHNNKKEKIIIQKINTTVFKEPYKLMNNIVNVTNWISEETKKNGDACPCLKVIKTIDGNPLAVVPDENGENQYYRAYNFIENSITYDVSTDTKIVYNTGKAFGHFQKMLDKFPVNSIEDTIPDFHNTRKRYKQFLLDVIRDTCGRVKTVMPEIEYLIKNSDNIANIVQGLEDGTIPVRVTHNDTKENNIMMDKTTGEAKTVVDLDTVMQGSSLYDYGDGIRSTASTAAEDEKDLSKVYLNNELFESYTDGYLSEMAPYLKQSEVKNMALGVQILTFELAVRFLNDYINGDTYFKITYPMHNLDRARNQIKLLQDITSKKSYMDDYINNSYQKILKK